MACVVARRVMDMARVSVEGSPFGAALSLCPEDAASFIDGDVDDALLEGLLFGCLWIDWRRSASRESIAELRSRWSRPLSDRPVSRPWALLKLLFSGSPFYSAAGQEVRPRVEPSVVTLLTAGRIGDACSIAQRRLLVSGLSPLRVDFPDGSDGIRLAGALLFPVRMARLMGWALAQAGGKDV
jgi:CRISPR-associated protein Csx17